MTNFQLAATVIVLTSAFAYVNARVFKLPSSVGLMATALVASVVLLALDATGAVALSSHVQALMTQLDFGNIPLRGMLGLLLSPAPRTSTSPTSAPRRSRSACSPSAAR